MFVLLPYLPSPYRSNFVKTFSATIRTHETILMSSFIKFCRCRKKGEIDSNCELEEQSGFIAYRKMCSNLCSLRWLKSKC